MPRLVGSVAFERVFVVVLAACLPLVARSLAGQFFSHDERHFLPALAAYGYLGEAGKVLSHVGYERRRVYLAFRRLRSRGERVCWYGLPRLYAVVLHYAHGLYCLRRKPSLRSFGYYGFSPSRVVETGLAASLLLQACVVRLAAVNAVERNRAERILPVVAALYYLPGSVGIVYLKAQQHLRGAEAGLQLAVSAHALHVEHAVAEQYADSVAACGYQVGYVEHVVIYCLVVLAPYGCELGVAHCGAVDVKAVVAEAAYVDHGVGYPFAPCVKAFAQYDAPC